MSLNLPPGTTFKDLSPENLKQVLEELKEPFDPEDIGWKPQNVKNKKALALAFADPRAYIDRLNDVVGPFNWSRDFQVTTSPYKKLIKGKAPWGSPPDTPVPPDQIVEGNKIVCVATVTVLGATQSSTGETDANDDNAATSSEAQAFKRALIAFGLGRYLYDLPKIEAAYDYGKFTETPKLPEWAKPRIRCEGCTKVVEPVSINGTTYTASRIAESGKSKYGQKLCYDCQKDRNKK